MLSILSVVAIPYAQNGAIRAKEVELRRALRSVRSAIDKFHYDCNQGRISVNTIGVSRYCYPESLEVLVLGIDSGDLNGTKIRYLRKIPRDPFLSSDVDIDDNWHFRGYQDDVDSSFWNGEDVYDISVTHDLISLDNGVYKGW